MQAPARLTPTSFIVLGLIEQVGVATPYQLKRMVGLSVGYFWSLQHAQLYSEPERLAAAGYLDVEREDSGRRRKRYSLTRRGREALDAWRAEPAAQPAEMREPALLKLFFGADPEPLAEAQLPAHRERLAEYERISERIRDSATEGNRLALEAGIRHEREWIRYWEDLAKRG
ncbi:MAG TPA: PadR family transcriptional regulator [Thermoleophilaceae bacterium]|nr:PadR family transcriptional regulator [Thermoleophilaceae bacterium]